MKKIFLPFLLASMMLPLVSCGKSNNENFTRIQPIANSILNDYKADISDAEAIGVGKISGKSQFVKQNAAGEVSAVSYIKKKASSSSRAFRSGDEEINRVTQDDLGVTLIECEVMSDITLLKYAKNIDKSQIYPNPSEDFCHDTFYGVYLPVLTNAPEGYIIDTSNRRDFYECFVKKGDSFEFIRDGLFYSNEIIQSYILHNETGYLYKIEFYKLNTFNDTDIYRYGEDKVGALKSINNKLVLCFEGFPKNEFEIEFVDDNLILTELPIITNARDKYGHHFLFDYESAKETSEVVHNNILVIGKGTNDQFAFLNENNEVVVSNDGKFYKFNENFVKEEVLYEEGKVIRKIDGYVLGLHCEGLIYVSNGSACSKAFYKGVIVDVGMRKKYVYAYSDLTYYLTNRWDSGMGLYENSEYLSNDYPQLVYNGGSFAFYNYDVDNVDDISGFEICIENNQLIKRDLNANVEVIKEIGENTTTEWYLELETETYMIKFTKEATLFEKEEITYVYFKTDGTYVIAEEETVVEQPAPKTYVLTPINKD